MQCKNCGAEHKDNFCPACGNETDLSVNIAQTAVQQQAQLQQQQIALQNQQQLDMQRQQLEMQQQQLNLQKRDFDDRMTCPRCGSHNVQVQLTEKQKKRGCLMSILWIFLALSIVGLIILIPLLTKKGSKTLTWAVCQKCGLRWRVR